MSDQKFVTILPDGAGRWKAELPAGLRGCTMLLKFGITAYPFERHFIHAELDEALPRTFNRIAWTQEGGGLRVGPWPGWRGIPELPPVRVVIDGRDAETRPVYFGDELRRGVMRLAAPLDSDAAATMQVLPSDERWIPLRAEFTPVPWRDAEPLPAALLPEFRESHPRLFFSAATLPALRSAAEGSKRVVWERVLTLLDGDDGCAPALTAQSKLPAGPERLFPEDRALLSAIAAAVEPTEERIAAAREALMAFAELTSREDYAPRGIDTQCGEMLFVLCAAYDWMQPLLSHSDDLALRPRIASLADACAAFLRPGRRDIAQAHFLGCGLGLLAFSIVCHETDPQASSRLAMLHGTLRRVLAMLPADGFYPHGINLWIYEHSFLLRWIEAFRFSCGVDLWDASPLGNASLFRASTAPPAGGYGITFGDAQYRTGGDAWCHLLIAARTGSAQAQATGLSLADEVTEGIDYRCAPARRRVYEFLFADTTLSAAPAIAPANAHFADGGQFFLRTAESLVTVRSGAPVGAARRGAGEYGGYGHSDPSNGAFLVHDRGEFVACGPGPSYRRDSLLHNIMTVDGLGQIGDGAVWYPDVLPDRFVPLAPQHSADGSAQLVTMDLGRCYQPELGVRFCRRALRIEAGVRILGIDRIALRRERRAQWNFHSWLAFLPEHADDAGFRFLLDGEHARSLTVALSQPADYRIGYSDFVPAYPHDGTRDHALVIETTASEFTLAWSLDLTASPVSSILLDGDRCEFLLQEQSGVTFDIAAFAFRPPAS